jgi:quinol monooxygenase YgiN
MDVSPPDDANGSPDRHDVSEPVLVTLRFDTEQPEALLDLLARYVVVSRTHQGCRNMDLVASITVPGRYLVVQKWAAPADQRRHFDSDDMVSFARACTGLLRHAPEVDLYDGISMHDLA